MYWAGFLFSISVALVSYINSSFLETYIGKNRVGLVYVAASVITILGLAEMPKILTRLGNRLTILLSCLVSFFSLVLLALGNSAFAVVFAFVLFFVSNGFIIASLDIFVEDFSKKSSIGSFRGFYLMMINLAWLASQVISGSVVNKISLPGIYLLSAGFMALTSFIFIFSLRRFEDPEYKKIPILKNIKTFLRNGHLSKIYLSNLILQFFYAWMIIYLPIYLHEYMGFGWGKIGVIFSIMLVPFVILDFPLGKLSDKIGERKMLTAGYLVAFISVLAISFIREPALWLWALALFGTRVGAATIEVMNESYFFKVVNSREAEEISFFRNAPSVAYIVAPFLAFAILSLAVPFKYLFLLLSIVLLLGFLTSLRLKEVK